MRESYSVALVELVELGRADGWSLWLRVLLATSLLAE
jgi:hypothetical protein